MRAQALIWTTLLLAAAACGDRSDAEPENGGTGAAEASGGTAASSSGATGASTSSGGAGEGGALGTGGADRPPPPPPGSTLVDRLTVTDITVPEGVKEGVSNWRVWGRGDLEVAPVFSAPRADCSTLVCYTTAVGDATTARVAQLGADGTLVTSHELAAERECRGLAAAPDGSFAALLWSDNDDDIYVHRYDAAGTELGVTHLTNADNHPDDFGIGESRLEYGAGRYGAYYHVHSDSGHEGDTLKWVDAATGAESTEWDWGCSHSMSNLLRFNPNTDTFLPVCVTDCYPGTSGDFSTNSVGGIYLNHNDGKVLDVDGGCNGRVAAELGSAALAPSGYQLVFNAHQDPATPGQSSYDEDGMNQDIGMVSVTPEWNAGTITWLTNTPTVDEADATIARWQPTDDATEQYLVGWLEPPATYWLARVDATGSWLEGPTNASAQIAWGHRDDPFRVAAGGDVVWAWFDAAGSTTLHFARVGTGATATCSAF